MVVHLLQRAEKNALLPERVSGPLRDGFPARHSGATVSSRLATRDFGILQSSHPYLFILVSRLLATYTVFLLISTHRNNYIRIQDANHVE